MEKSEKHVLRVLSREGDTEVAWRPAYKLEVQAAEQQFKTYQDQGYAMFAVEAPGKKPVQIRSFDPAAFEILAVPALKGG